LGYLFLLGAGGGIYNHYARHLATLLEAIWRCKSCGSRKYIGRPIYLVQTTDPGSWVNPITMYNTLASYLDAKAIPYKKLATYDDLMSYLWTTPPPENIIVVNCHGEGHSIPDALYDLWDEATGTWFPDADTNIESYYKGLGDRIYYNGWLVIELVGYPFFYAFQAGQSKGVGPNGLNFVLTPTGLTTDAWGTTAYDIRDCCALKRNWNPAWGAISRSVVRWVRPVGDFNYWQFNFLRLERKHSVGAIPFAEPTGLRLFV